MKAKSLGYIKLFYFPITSCSNSDSLWYAVAEEFPEWKYYTNLFLLFLKLTVLTIKNKKQKLVLQRSSF